MKAFRRRKFVVNKRLQYSLMIIAISYVVVFVLVLGAALFAPLAAQLQSSELQSQEAYNAAQGFLYLHTRFWPAALLTLTAIGLHSLYTSHKIAGPLYRFHRVFDAVKTGRLPKPTKLRKGDYLHSEMESVNEMLESMRTKIGEVKEIQASMDEMLSACVEKQKNMAEPELKNLMADVFEKGKKLDAKLAAIIVDP